MIMRNTFTAFFFLDRFLFPNFFVCLFIICLANLQISSISLNLSSFQERFVCEFGSVFFTICCQKNGFFWGIGGSNVPQRSSRGQIVKTSEDFAKKIIEFPPEICSRGRKKIFRTCFSMYFSCIISRHYLFFSFFFPSQNVSPPHFINFLLKKSHQNKKKRGGQKTNSTFHFHCSNQIK